MFKLIELLWPFFLEVFVNNQEVTDAVRRPDFIIKTVLGIVFTLSVGFYLIESASDLLAKTHDTYTTVTTDYNLLEQRYETLLADKNELAGYLATVRIKNMEQSHELKRCTEQCTQNKNDVEVCREALDNCHTQCAQQSQKPSSIPPSVIDRLKRVQ